MPFSSFANRAALEAELIEKTVMYLEAGLAARDSALLVVSGGNTPVPLFNKLARVPLPWHKISVTLADERWVAPDDPRSNERLLRESLLTGHAASAQFVGLKSTHATPEQGQPAINSRLATLPWPADIILLGMGEDGHFASLFPDSNELLTAMTDCSQRRCCAINSATAGVARISLTLPTLLETHFLALHIVGVEKRQALSRAQQCGSITGMPVRALFQQKLTALNIFWAP
ncbi:MAG TPA: 6-phosphogluconolactonase [Spongiibacteraceae bacterium]|nr:6-phosphogluconolactonase [Spongiibacteraceae bacterium]